MIKISKAMNLAAKEFEKLDIGYIRNLKMFEGTGNRNQWVELTIGVDYVDKETREYKEAYAKVYTSIINGKCTDKAVIFLGKY